MAGFDGVARGRLGADLPEGDGEIIAEAKERYAIAMEADPRTEAMEDLKFLCGAQWDAEAEQNRKLDNRPMLTNNNLPAIVHQVTNDARQNKQSIQVHAVDGNADPETAKVIEGIVRHVEYDSGADAAYDTAMDGAAQVGFGFFRLITEYENPMSFNQVLKIKRIRNHFTVLLDPNSQEADTSDKQYAFVSSRMAKAAFKREHPTKTATIEAIGTSTGDGDIWFSGEFVRIAEYYRIEYTARRICLLGDGTVKFKEDVLSVEHVVEERTTQLPKTMWYKITGAEVLDKREIPCPWIPVFAVYGDEIDLDGKIERWGLIRNAKSPKMMENYWMTAATEEIALRTKTPFIGALGQFEGVSKDWDAANVRNFPYLEYVPVVATGEDGQSHVVPAPQRQAPADVPSGYIAMAGLARDTVKAVTGIYDASLGNRSNEVSGLAIRARQQQGDIANFHFSDNLTRAIRLLAKCMIAMIPRVYDTERVIRIIGEDRKTVDRVTINQPNPAFKAVAMPGAMPPPPAGGAQDETKQAAAVKRVLNDLTVGTYDVVVTTGPAYNTLRQEAAANLVELGGKWPKLMEVAGDKVIRALDFPGGEEIAERVEKTMPPELRDKDENEQAPPMVQTPKGPIPIDQAGQMIGQMDHTLEQMQGEMEELQSGLAKARIDAESREEVARINAQSRADVEELKGMITMLVTRMNPLLAHEAAVAAAADPAHPAAPAPVAQAVEAAPIIPDPAQAGEGAPEPTAGDQQAAAPENEGSQ
jgi:hypothetical protein